MEKDKFLQLDIKEQVSFINSRTTTGLKVIEVAKEINIGDKTLRNMLKHNGYTFNRNEKQYILDGIIEKSESNKTGIINKVEVHPKEIMEQSKSKPIGIIKEEQKALFSDKEVKELKELLAIKDKLLNIVSIKEESSNNSTINITELDKTNRKKATYNLDINLISKLEEYKNTLKNVSVSDIVNVALMEYLERNN